MKQETKAYCKALTNIVLALIGVVLLITVLPRVLSFFMPFVVAWIIALLASPMVKFLEEKLKIKRKAGTACVIIAVIAVIVLIGYGVAAFLIDQIQGLMRDLPDIWDNLQVQIDEVSRSLSKFFVSLPADVQESWSYFFENVESFLGEWVASLGVYRRAHQYAELYAGLYAGDHEKVLGYDSGKLIQRGGWIPEGAV